MSLIKEMILLGGLKYSGVLKWGNMMLKFKRLGVGGKTKAGSRLVKVHG